MTQIILGQVRFLVMTMCLGMALMAGYELLHFVRWLYKHAKWLIVVEDLLYWCMVSIPAYIVFFIFNDGIIRWYGVLSMLLGGILYEKGLGRPIRTKLARLLWKPKMKWWSWKSRRKELRKEKKKKRRKEKDRQKENTEF